MADGGTDITKDPEFRAIVKAGGPDMNGKLQALFAARQAATSAPVPLTEGDAPAGGRDARRQAVFTVADSGGPEAPPMPPTLDAEEQRMVAEDLGMRAKAEVGPVQATARPAPPPPPKSIPYPDIGGVQEKATQIAAGHNLFNPPPEPPRPPPTGAPGATIPAAAAPAATPAAQSAVPETSPLQQEMMGIDDVARLSAMSRGGPGAGASSAAMVGLRDANANVHAAVQNLQAEVIRRGTDAAAEGTSKAIALGKYSQQLQEQSDAALQERQRLQDEVARRGKLVDEASQQFAREMRGAPLGTALNPDSAMKITGAIGLALGGALQGFRGGPNPALSIISTAIDRDLQQRKLAIEAGKYRMDATNQAYHTSFQVLGDWDAATAQMRANLFGQAKLTAESITAQGLGDEKLGNAKVLSAELSLKEQEAKQAAAAAAYKAAQAGRTQDPLKRLEQVLKLKGLAADVAAKVSKAEGGGGEEQLKVGQMVVALRQARLPQFYAALTPIHEVLQDPSKLPPNFLRALQSQVDSSIAHGRGDLSFGAVVAITFAKMKYSPEQLAQANRFINAWNKAVYSATGAQLNETEVGRIRRGAGLAPWGTPEELQAGLKSMEQDVRSQARMLRNANPKVFDRLMGENAKVVGVDEPADDGFDPSKAPQPGR